MVEMSAVVNRLRESARTESEMQKQKGRLAGRVWAMLWAEAAELKRLDKLRQDVGGDWETWFIDNEYGSYCVSERFYLSVFGDEKDEVDRNDAKPFWRDHGANDDHPGTDFVRDFADGALAVWDEVKDQI